MKITNIDESEEIKVVSSDIFTFVDGDPQFDTEYATKCSEAARNTLNDHTELVGIINLLTMNQ